MVCHFALPPGTDYGDYVQRLFSQFGGLCCQSTIVDTHSRALTQTDILWIIK